MNEATSATGITPDEQREVSYKGLGPRRPDIVLYDRGQSGSAKIMEVKVKGTFDVLERGKCSGGRDVIRRYVAEGAKAHAGAIRVTPSTVRCLDKSGQDQDESQVSEDAGTDADHIAEREVAAGVTAALEEAAVEGEAYALGRVRAVGANGP